MTLYKQVNGKKMRMTSLEEQAYLNEVAALNETVRFQSVKEESLKSLQSLDAMTIRALRAGEDARLNQIEAVAVVYRLALEMLADGRIDEAEVKKTEADQLKGALNG